jgi:hypothetical protein
MGNTIPTDNTKEFSMACDKSSPVLVCKDNHVTVKGLSKVTTDSMGTSEIIMKYEVSFDSIK